MTNRLNLKREVEFQCGRLPFSETGSSFISAVDCDISSKFGMQIDFRFLSTSVTYSHSIKYGRKKLQIKCKKTFRFITTGHI